MTVVADRFSTIFREEHREVRDTLFELIDAFQANDHERIGTGLVRVATLTGPHFRYEEESMYPALVAIFGPEYVAKLLVDHDRAIGAALRLVQIAAKDPLTEEDSNEAVALVRGILPHVSDCDGLSIMVERLPDEQVQDILSTRDEALGPALDLLTWAKEVRDRSPIWPDGHLGVD